MKQIILYRILTYILVPVAAFLGFFTVLALFAALVNPAVLIGVFMLACIVIYTFSSLSFLNKGIIKKLPCKPSLRDWIRVNAFVSLLFASLSLFQSASLLSNPVSLQQALDAAISSQPNLPASLTPQLIKSVMSGSLYFMLFLSIILLIHIFFTFRLLPQYKQVFSNKA